MLIFVHTKYPSFLSHTNRTWVLWTDLRNINFAISRMRPKRKFESDALDTDGLSCISNQISTGLPEQRPISKDGHTFLYCTAVTFDGLL